MGISKEKALNFHQTLFQSIAVLGEEKLTHNQQRELQPQLLLSDSNTNVNSMINRRVSLLYRYPLKAFHHMVCPCT